ncbi:IucA/IucC family protein [Methylobacterium sp. Leaf469]|jgi:siderophore synthetase component|uniref:IucA/IucC family protein n=1 Tax=Methylobacterium sp. Leaf469 TaxID=1736387 RepID=UPI0006F62F6A|nr:IucA/IucC family protein [Methylobacterium sp. Leaf469]KQT89899.1 IucA/IucC family protein [Methylobacterium sp. Leaf469]
MPPSSQHVAEAAAFRSFANGYLREIDPGIRVRHARSDGPPAACVEWNLGRRRIAIRAEIRSPSLCGAQGFGILWTRHLHEPRWRRVAPMQALQDLLAEAYARVDAGRDESARAHELELLGRVLDSYRETARQLDLAREPAGESATTDTSFIGAERSLVYGHWLHPTPKSRQGLSTWQARVYAPEEAGGFQLAVFAVEAGRVRHDSAAPRSAPEIALELLGADAGRLPLRAGEIALPMHPLQADALKLDPDIAALMEAGRVRCLGAFGPRYTATSSVRTVYAPDSPWMAKFSLPVTLTNSLRVNRFAELEAGVAMARLLARNGFGTRHPTFRIVSDPAYLTLHCPGRDESGFETVLRENPFRDGAERGVATLAALAAEPLPGRPSRLDALLRRLAPGGADERARTARAWFGLYLDCMLEPVVALYDRHGIALEAHQQNALLDVAAGWPRRGYYRDNQGFYLSEDARPRLLRQAPETAAIAALYFPDDEIRRRLAYYLVVNQIFSVIARMGHDGTIRESVLLDDLARRLEAMARRMTGAGRAFARSVLDGPTLCTKANLRVRLADRDELASGDGTGNYIDMPNPLRARAAAYCEAGRALAS